MLNTQGAWLVRAGHVIKVTAGLDSASFPKRQAG